MTSPGIESLLAGPQAPLAALYDGVSDVVFVLDVDGDTFRFASVNRRFLEATGLAEPQVIGKRVQEVIPEPAHALVLGKYREAIASGRPVAWEEVSAYPAGLKIGQVMVTPLRDAAGLCRQLLGTVRDVTEATRMQQVLQENEARLRMALAVGGMGAWQWDIRKDSVIWWPGMDALHGLPAGTAIASMRAYEEFVHPEDRAYLMQAVEQALAARQDTLFDYRIVWPDGSVHWIEGRGKLFLDMAGAPSHMSGICVDISLRKNAEQALRQWNEALEDSVAARTAERDRIWRNSPDLLAVLGSDGVFHHLNPAWTAVLGYATSELTGRRFYDFLHPEDIGPSKQATGHAAARVLTGFENRYRHKDGSYRWFSWSATPEDGAIYAVGRDVTVEKERADALRRAEDALRQAQKMEAVGQLTGGIAHDFNNLLAGMVGNLEMMKLRHARGDMQELARYIDSAIAAADRAAALTHRLLAFSRRQTLDPKPVDANRLVSSLLDLIGRSVGPGIRIDTRLAEDLWLTRCDINQLESSLLNLAINARDAMPDGGRLLIETANIVLDRSHAGYAAENPDGTSGDYIMISVTDTGCGMPEDIAARVFEPFFTTKPLGQGTGLGLSMVYGFVKQSGGHIRLTSAPGQGTTVRLKLPRHAGAMDAGDPDMAGNRPREDRSAIETTTRTVLVVDDEASLRGLLAELLESLGCIVLQAADGIDGLRILQSAAVDVLVTDVGLPGGMNGVQLADAAQALRPDLPVLFITGYVEDVAGDGLLAGGRQLLTKPFGLEAFSDRVRNLLAAVPAP